MESIANIIGGSMGAMMIMIIGPILFFLSLICFLIPKKYFSKKWLVGFIFFIIPIFLFILRAVVVTFSAPSMPMPY